MESFKCVVSPQKRSGASRRLSTSLTRCCLSVASGRDRAHKTQLPWAEVKKEMTQEKGLDSTIADKIGQYVMLKGAGVEGGRRRSPTPHSALPALTILTDRVTKTVGTTSAEFYPHVE